MIVNQEFETLRATMTAKDAQIDALTKKINNSQQDTVNQEVVQKKGPADVVELQNQISKLNAELTEKDDLMRNLLRPSPALRPKSTSMVGADVGLLRQLENEKEARLAQQGHIIFLSQELAKLEREVKTKDAKIQTLTDLLASAAQPASSEEESRRLRHQVATLQENYFLSLGRSVKLQGTLVGWYANVSLSELYEEAMQKKIPVVDWPSWITRRFQNLGQKSPADPAT